MANSEVNSGPGSTGEEGAEIKAPEANKGKKRAGLKVRAVGAADQSESGPPDPNEQPKG